MAITSDGVLYGWGSNEFGQLGDGTTINRHSPIRIMEDVTFVHVTDWQTMAITTDGVLWGWGSNSIQDRAGEIFSVLLGDGTTEDRLSPVQIMEDVASIYVFHGRKFVITSDGVLWGWGDNAFGELGDGTTERRYSPVRIMYSILIILVEIQSEQPVNHNFLFVCDGVFFPDLNGFNEVVNNFVG